MTDQTVTVVIVRHPDSETDYSAYAPPGINVEFVTADLGSGFDGRPTNRDEAIDAREIARTLTAGVATLPADSATRRMAEGWADSLLEAASEYLDEDDDEDEG